jgi:hypothetical protein
VTVARLVVAAVLVVAVAAAADALRRGTETVAGRLPASEGERVTLVGRDPGEYAAVGEVIRTRVLRHGREYLSPESVDAAFPLETVGAFDIAHLAKARDGAIALAVYKFPWSGGVRGGVEVWRTGVLVGAFLVPPGSFGGGLAFTRDGRVAALAPGGRTATIFARSGRREGEIRLR